MQAELVSLVEGFPDTILIHAGLEDDFLRMGVINQRAVGSDGIAAGLVHVQLLQLKDGAVQWAARGDYYGVTCFGSLLNGRQILWGNILVVVQQGSVQIHK